MATIKKTKSSSSTKKTDTKKLESKTEKKTSTKKTVSKTTVSKTTITVNKTNVKNNKKTKATKAVVNEQGRKRVKSASSKATKKVNTKKPKTVDKTKKPLKHISITKKTIKEGINLNIASLKEKKEQTFKEQEHLEIQENIFDAPAFYDYDYGAEKLVMLPIDPQFGFVYWDFKASTLEHAFAYKNANLILRFHDVTNINFNGYNANESWDVKVYGHRGTWYLNHDRGDRYLIVEIGVLEYNGTFTPFAKSNLTYFPSNKVSENTKIRWMTVDEFGNKIISDQEEFTKADLKLLKKLLGDDLYDILFIKKEIPVGDTSNFRIISEESVNILGSISSFFKS